MKQLRQKTQSVLSKYVVFFMITVLVLWGKTYITQLTQFQLGIDNKLQHFLLFLNPLGSALFFLGLSFLFKGRRKYSALLTINFLLSFLLFANVMYYRFFNDFITLPTIMQTQNFGDVSSSIPTLLQPTDILFFIDTIVFVALLAFKFVKIDTKDLPRRKVLALFTLALAISTANLQQMQG